MNVREMMSLETFSGFKVIAGEAGLSSEVTGINVMDAPDVYMWVRGGEFLATTAYIFKDNPEELVTLVKKIHKAGAVALGIKIERFIKKVPPSVLTLADEIGFPIIGIPYDFAFSEIINPLLAEIIEKNTKRLEYSERIHNAFTDLALMGASTQKIIESLGNIIHTDFCYQDLQSGSTLQYRKLSSTHNSKTAKEIPAVDSSKLHTIRYRGKPIGIFTFYDVSDLDLLQMEYMDIAIKHASTVLLLDLQKRISNKQLESKYRDELLQDMLLNNLGSYEELQNRAELYDWSFTRNLSALIIEIDHAGNELHTNQHITKQTLLRDTIFNLAKKEFLAYFPEAKYTNFSGSIVFLIPSNDARVTSPKELYHEVCEKVKSTVREATERTITIGIGQPHQAMETHIGYQEAKRSIRLGRMLKGYNKTVYYEDLGAFRLLELVNNEQLLRYRDQYIRPLLDHDSCYKSEFVETLRALSQCDWIVREAAKKLFVHYNTVKRRIAKINLLLGVDINHFENRLNIALAIKIEELLLD